MSAMDRLFEMMTRDSLWTTTAPTTTVRYEKIEHIEQLSIIPDTEHGPMLEIASKNKEGITLYAQRLNLAAVDDLIGRLIKMRDHMAQMKRD